ncbi:hypothetical protein LINPERPRIM_LOCUS32826, partial [Linum perenne]
MGDEMINIVIWHGGRMDFSGSVPKYKGGEENVVGFDTDYLSYRILIACAKEDLGYQSVHRMWWLPPKKLMKNGLRELFGDMDILYGLMLDLKKVEDGQVILFFETEKEVSGGWDNEAGNLGDDVGMNGDDDIWVENSVQSLYPPFIVVSDESDDDEEYDQEEVVERSMSDMNLPPNSSSTEYRKSSESDHGLIQALEQFLPHTEHGKCARHVWAKWKLKHGTSASKDAFWKAVYSSNEVEYDKHANKLKELQDKGTDRGAYDDFIKQEPKRFCRAFLSTIAKSDLVESNVCESFNNAIVRFRDLQIIKMLEGIRFYLMDWKEVVGLPILPPPYKVMPGRPKKNRRKEPGEISTRPSHTGVGEMMRKTGATMHCSRCGQADHNVRGCKMTSEEAASLPKPPPPKPVGRPRRRPIEEPHPNEEPPQ